MYEWVFQVVIMNDTTVTKYKHKLAMVWWDAANQCNLSHFSIIVGETM